jgi:hypothetical protein
VSRSKGEVMNDLGPLMVSHIANTIFLVAGITLAIGLVAGLVVGWWLF